MCEYRTCYHMRDAIMITGPKQMRSCSKRNRSEWSVRSPTYVGAMKDMKRRVSGGRTEKKHSAWILWRWGKAKAKGVRPATLSWRLRISFLPAGNRTRALKSAELFSGPRWKPWRRECGAWDRVDTSTEGHRPEDVWWRWVMRGNRKQVIATMYR